MAKDAELVAVPDFTRITADRWLIRIIFPTLVHHREYVLKRSCGGVWRSRALTWSVGRVGGLAGRIGIPAVEG